METRSRLFPEVHSDRPGGNRHKLKHYELQSDVRKNFCNIWAIKYWNRDLYTVDSPPKSTEYLNP